MRFSHSKEHRGCPEKNQRQLKNTSRSLSGPKKPRVAKKSIHNRWLGGYVGNKCGHQSPDKPYPPVFIDTHNFTKEPHPNDNVLRALFRWDKFPDATTFGRVFRLFSARHCKELAEVEDAARRKV
jgi:hypothetical protein